MTYLNQSVLSILLLACAAQAQPPERAHADLRCKASGKDFVYECSLRLRGAKTGAPMSGVEITVSADMPSMPMAHSIEPVKATPAGTPGLYTFRLALEMLGVWTVKLRLAGRVKDQLVETLDFDRRGATKPSSRR